MRTVAAAPPMIRSHAPSTRGLGLLVRLGLSLLALMWVMSHVVVPLVSGSMASLEVLGAGGAQSAPRTGCATTPYAQPTGLDARALISSLVAGC